MAYLIKTKVKPPKGKMINDTIECDSQEQMYESLTHQFRMTKDGLALYPDTNEVTVKWEDMGYEMTFTARRKE